jgi:murein L,D-transpeptidase YafK
VIFVQTLEAQNLPSSQRLKEVKKKREAELKKALSEKGFSWGSPVFMRIFKTEKQLELWIKQGNTYKLYKTYDICTFGSGGLGPKLKEGDGMAPEGFYFVRPKQFNPYSSFHLAFNLGYPNAYDRAHNRTGSALMVHGSCVSIGCYAMSDPVIEEIYLIAEAALKSEQPFFRVHIFPFRMTEFAVSLVKKSKWYDYWLNLKTGYDYFEKHKLPPNVRVQNKKYVFD